jgi:hypothetical protein
MGVKVQGVCVAVFLCLLGGCAGQATRRLSTISVGETSRVLNVLADDEMKGRKVYTPEIDKAADFIASEFAKAGLKPLRGEKSYIQSFVNAHKDGKPATWEFKAFGDGADAADKLSNVVGVLPGKKKPNEYVIISAHYDHLGIGKPVNGDAIYNGANDDASGTTAVILLAKYFSAANDNARSIIFVAFTGEEVGGWGSRYFSKQLNADEIKAMLNIEMIGTESKWGRNSAYITGYDKTDMGAILQKNLKDSAFTFQPDPYTDQKLFYRSDNATLARLGVPAHTVSTSKMDNEPNYHKVSDEVRTLDLENMTEIIKALALSAQSIVDGADTPTRVKEEPKK